MPRNGSGVFSRPAGTTPTNGDELDAVPYNLLMDDFVADLNTPRPVVAGGTGASDAATALANLGLTATAEQLNAAAAISAPNLIINGSGIINQRNYPSAQATTITNQFTIDRWFVPVSGQSLGVGGSAVRQEMTAPAGGVAQVIEGRNILGGTYVINWTGTATVTVNGTARTKGETFTLSASTNARVIFYNGTFTDVKVELGSIPTPFAPPDYAAELLKCHRYFWVLPIAIDVFGYASGGGDNAASYVYLPTTMRVAPTVSAFMSNGSNFNSSARYASPAVVAVVITGTSAGGFSARYDAGNTFDAEMVA